MPTQEIGCDPVQPRTLVSAAGIELVESLERNPERVRSDVPGTMLTDASRSEPVDGGNVLVEPTGHDGGRHAIEWGRV